MAMGAHPRLHLKKVQQLESLRWELKEVRKGTVRFAGIESDVQI